MTVKRMDNVGIVVESLDAVIPFFTELGLKLEGRATIEGEWAGRVTGLASQRVEIAMLLTPDGHGRLELSRFLEPPVVADHRNAPVNALGYLRVMFAVDNLDETLVRLRGRGGQLVGEVVQYEDVYRLCYMRGPEGVLIGLAEELRSKRRPERAGATMNEGGAAVRLAPAGQVALETTCSAPRSGGVSHALVSCPCEGDHAGEGPGPLPCGGTWSVRRRT